VTLEFNLLT